MRGRDRTAEFVATINSKRQKPQFLQQRQSVNEFAKQQSANNRLAIDPQYRELMQISQKCAHRIKDSCAKLEKFTHLAKRRTVFDDGELNKLISEIRMDISETKGQLDYLQSNCGPKQKHTENIVGILHRKLANVTSNFKSTLEMRSRSVQQQTARHEMFAGPTPSTSNQSPYQSNGPMVLDMSGTNATSPYQHSQMPQQLIMNDQIDLSERADKMQIIESTIVELGTVFNQLATIVQDQGETITRIDMNISDTTANVEMAHDALLRYFSSINSNRWLILKVFGVLFFFFIIFVVFST